MLRSQGERGIGWFSTFPGALHGESPHSSFSFHPYSIHFCRGIDANPLSSHVLTAGIKPTVPGTNKTLEVFVPSERARLAGCWQKSLCCLLLKRDFKSNWFGFVGFLFFSLNETTEMESSVSKNPTEQHRNSSRASEEAENDTPNPGEASKAHRASKVVSSEHKGTFLLVTLSQQKEKHSGSMAREQNCPSRRNQCVQANISSLTPVGSESGSQEDQQHIMIFFMENSPLIYPWKGLL